MKNIMIIDGANNCAYDIFQAGEELFAAIFPAKGQNIEFIDDFMSRYQNEEFDAHFAAMWKRPVAKSQVSGIHGILFYELSEQKQRFYPNKKDSDLDYVSRPFSVAELEG